MRPLTLAALAALALSPVPALSWDIHRPSCGTRGSGHKVTQPRDLADFDAVRLEGSLDVAVRVGAPRAVSVTIDDNLQPLVETRLEGRTLVIRTREASWDGVGRVDVVVPALKAFAIDGSGDVEIDGGSGDLALSVEGSGDLSWRGGSAGLLDVSIAGSGEVKVSGTAQRLRVAIAGSGSVSAAKLTATSAEIEVSGSGGVEVTMGGGSFRAAVSGSGDVVWHGTAQVERAEVSGSGEIVRR